MAKKEKKQRPTKCAQCDLEFPQSPASEDFKDKAFLYKGKIVCEDCLVMMGGTPGNEQIWWDFSKDQNKSKPHDW
jgi:hypothetical protein